MKHVSNNRSFNIPLTAGVGKLDTFQWSLSCLCLFINCWQWLLLLYLCASHPHPVSNYLNNKMVAEEIRTILCAIFTYILNCQVKWKVMRIFHTTNFHLFVYLFIYLLTYLHVKVKVKTMVVPALKAPSRSLHILPIILKLRNRGRWVVRLTPRPALYPRKKLPYTRWIAGWFGFRTFPVVLENRKNSCPAVFRSL